MPTIRITWKNHTAEVPAGTLLRDAIALLPRSAPEDATPMPVLAAMCGGRVLELNSPLEQDASITLLTYRDEEGRRLYERSLRFLFLASMKRLFPGQRVRMQHSVGYGLYIAPRQGSLTHQDVRALESDMRSLAAQDLPFEKLTWTRQQAIDYFEAEGWQDKAELLRYRPQETMTMYRMAGLCEYFYGAMLPSTGLLTAFELKPHHPGLVLCAPDPHAPEKPAPYVPRKKFLQVFDESRRWCSILGAQNVSDVNRMIRNGRIREFIRINEALHDRSIAAIADDILRRRARIVMIFGPSSSGKTTFANRLKVHLQVLGKLPHMVSLDDFYRNRADLPLEADGTPDLENVDALDIPLLTQCLEGLLGGDRVDMPLFDFQTASRSPKVQPMQLGPEELLLVEGIHGMNDRIVSELPEQLMYGVYVSALGCINLDDHNRIRTTDVRLLRRMVRDMRKRNTTPAQTIDMWPKVRIGEEKWIFPYQERADVMFNTSLHYELPVLKTMAYELLLQIPPSAPQHLAARRLLKMLHYFLPVGGAVLEEIPPLSILREFVGDSAFYDIH